jgi:hypothetical protein
MRHTRNEVLKRTISEFKLLDRLVSKLTLEEWKRPLLRSETKDPWTVKDALAHITHWKEDAARSAKGLPRPPLTKLNVTDGNHRVYVHWRNRSPKEVLAWHRQVQKKVLAVLKELPDDWFTGKERRSEWPFDLDGHSEYHRVKDIERALAKGKVRR